MQTLGDVITWALIAAAVVFVPYKIAKAWLWPYIKPMMSVLFGGPTVKDSDGVMSRTPRAPAPAAPVRGWPEPAEPPAVLADTHQSEPGEPGENEPPCEPARLYRLSRQDEIIILATQRDENGAYRHSANDITKFMGGTAADVKDLIRAVRDPNPTPDPPAQSVKRPANGWR